MKKIQMFLLLVLWSMTVLAQNTDEQKKKIASIKKDNSYIYAEVTTTDQQQAIDLATDLLHKNVNEWAAKKKKFAGSSKIITLNTSYTIDQITMPRANMFRAFVYVKKSDVIPAENVEVRQTPKEIADKATRPEAATIAPISNSTRDVVISELLTVKNTGQLSEKLKQLKSKGKVQEYNNLRGLKGKNQAEYIMVVFNKEGNVEAFLSEGENRTNLITGSLDQLTNYKGRGAIGVKVSK